MTTHGHTQRARAALAALFTILFVSLPMRAFAAPGGTGVETFGRNALQFLSGTLGPIVLGLGLAIAAYGLIFGSRDGLMRAVWVVVGGVMLFSAEGLVSWIQQASGS